jgi:hypothetical protein
MTPRERETARDARNLIPHAAARVAMALYNERYAAQGGGSMDFWDSLTDGEKQTCASIAKQIREARPYRSRHDRAKRKR